MRGTLVPFPTPTRRLSTLALLSAAALTAAHEGAVRLWETATSRKLACSKVAAPVTAAASPRTAAAP
jgi:hypothetical protein